MDEDALEAKCDTRHHGPDTAQEASMTLQDKRIIILGGTSGIGLAVAQAAAAEGARIVVASSNTARVEEALTTLPGAEGHPVDLADAAAVEVFFDGIGAFDHLVYTAGEALKLASLADCDLASARRFFELRYWGAFTAAKYAHRRIRPGGSIVFTSGVAGARPRANWSVAASICAAMEGLTRALAVELAPVRVNIVSPGVVKTPLWRDMTAETREALYAAEAARLPVGHVAEPDEIAAGYLYLMRQGSVTGQTLAIDGGGLLT
jgi:NAD(P)-dependent dehydrogenase (short-subunit alcohol dehydrogenase family)